MIILSIEKTKFAGLSRIKPNDFYNYKNRNDDSDQTEKALLELAITDMSAIASFVRGAYSAVKDKSTSAWIEIVTYSDGEELVRKVSTPLETGWRVEVTSSVFSLNKTMTYVKEENGWRMREER